MTAAALLAQITPFVTRSPTPFELAAGYVGVWGGAALCVGLAFAAERRAERAGGRSVGAMLRAAFRPAVLGLAGCGAVVALAPLLSGRAGLGEVAANAVGLLLIGALYVPIAWAVAVVASIAARALTPKGVRTGPM